MTARLTSICDPGFDQSLTKRKKARGHCCTLRGLQGAKSSVRGEKCGKPGENSN